jgi:alpha-glucosidase
MPSTSYRFLIFTNDGTWWYTGSGAQRGLPTDAADFRLLAGYQVPTWVRSSVFYQIFPDRFADGDPASNIRDGEFEYRGLRSTARHWGEPPNPNGYHAMVEFYGGDLTGIQQRLDTIAGQASMPIP